MKRSKRSWTWISRPDRKADRVDPRDGNTPRRVPQFRFLHLVESGNDMQLRSMHISTVSFTGNKHRFRRTTLNRNPVFVCCVYRKNQPEWCRPPFFGP